MLAVSYHCASGAVVLCLARFDCMYYCILCAGAETWAAVAGAAAETGAAGAAGAAVETGVAGVAAETGAAEMA